MDLLAVGECLAGTEVDEVVGITVMISTLSVSIRPDLRCGIGLAGSLVRFTRAVAGILSGILVQSRTASIVVATLTTIVLAASVVVVVPTLPIVVVIVAAVVAAVVATIAVATELGGDAYRVGRQGD